MKKTQEATLSEIPSSDTRLCWEILDLNGNPFMQIRPYPTDLCYQLYEWDKTVRRQTKEEVWEWKPIDCYPYTLEQAFKYVKEYMVKRCGGATDDVSKMIQICKQIDKHLKEARGE